jgi:hypothetical protein
MGVPKTRVTTLQTLIRGSVLHATPFEAIALSEYQDVYQSNRVRRLPRRFLLQVLHSTRGLDTCLARFVTYHNVPLNRAPALGSYLHALTQHRLAVISRLLQADQRRYQNSIVNERNRYMHEAGTAPVNDAEVETLLSEMDHCLTTVFNL